MRPAAVFLALLLAVAAAAPFWTGAAGAPGVAGRRLPAAGPPGGGTAAAPPPPERVVSMNLCTDLLAMLLAAPGQLVSVSHVARDPLSSPLWRQAAAIPVNHAGAEQIFLTRPDLVLAGAYDAPATVAMLRRLGVRVEQFPLETSFADIRVHLRRIGALLGRQARAEALVARFDAALAAAAAPEDAHPRAVLFYAGSYTSGAGTLADAVVAAAGFENVAATLGYRGLTHLPLEMLVMARPDLIVAGRDYAAPARAQEVLDHPAARALAGASRVRVADNLWACGTPLVAEAVADLAAARRALAR
jgi:iron complex transport system substrate-binding protein